MGIAFSVGVDAFDVDDAPLCPLAVAGAGWAARWLRVSLRRRGVPLCSLGGLSTASGLILLRWIRAAAAHRRQRYRREPRGDERRLRHPREGTACQPRVNAAAADSKRYRDLAGAVFTNPTIRGRPAPRRLADDRSSRRRGALRGTTPVTRPHDTAAGALEPGSDASVLRRGARRLRRGVFSPITDSLL